MSKKINPLLKQLIEDSLSSEGIGSTKRNRNLSSFLVNKEEIQEALTKGWNIKSIWKLLNNEGNFPGCYETFLKYIKNYIPVKDNKINLEEKNISKLTRKKKKNPFLKHLKKTWSINRTKKF